LEIIIEDWCIGCGMCADDCPFGNINMIPQFEVSPSDVELVLNGPPAEFTLSGTRIDRVKEVIVTVGKGGERAQGIDADPRRRARWPAARLHRKLCWHLL